VEADLQPSASTLRERRQRVVGTQWTLATVSRHGRRCSRSSPSWRKPPGFCHPCRGLLRRRPPVVRR
jgi:hypothetical protein